MTRRLLVAGASGFVGGRVLEALARVGQASGTCRFHPGPGLDALDLADRDAVRRLLDRRRPELVINCAALAEPDACEKDPAAARRANADAPRALAQACAERGARLLHLSTDLVFDGARGRYAETDEARPLSVYGRTKLEGERAVLEACPSAAVVRVSLVYGFSLCGRPSFLEWLLGELEGGRRPRLFVDQWRTPTPMAQLPEVLVRLADRGAAGVFHWGGAQRVSRLDFGRAVCRVFGHDASRLEPLEMKSFGYAATRPADCSLDSGTLAALLGVSPWTVEEGLVAERGRRPSRP
jgi:dTDP-4-dehydrorhamnose reductase